MQITIRPIEQKDNSKIGRLIKEVLTEFKANKPGTAFFDESTDHLSTVFVHQNTAYWIVELDNELVGGAGIFPTEGLPTDTCELVKLYLHPGARGKGIGKLLIQTCLEKAKSLGFKDVYLESMPELNNAVSLYEKSGFERLNQPLGNSGHFGCNIWMLKQL